MNSKSSGLQNDFDNLLADFNKMRRSFSFDLKAQEIGVIVIL